MSPNKRIEVFKNFKFIVEIDGLVQSRFSEIILPEIQIDVLEYRDGSATDNGFNKLPGLTHYGNLILRWGITDSMELYNWFKIIEEGNVQDARKNAAIILLNDKNEPVARWEFLGIFPVKYKIAPLNAQSPTILIEELEIAVEKMRRVQ